MSHARTSISGGTPSESSAYVGLDLLQEQTRIRALRKGFVFNLMVAGRSGLGKSTLVNSLFKTPVARKKPATTEAIPSTTEIKKTTCVLNERGVTLTLTITDTPGFGDNVNNENCWEPLVDYIEDQYWKYLKDEQKTDRPFHIPDTRIHCCIYFIQPSGHELSSLDIEVLTRLDSIVNLIPVIAKADTLTPEERTAFKERIRSDLEDHEIKIYPDAKTENPEDAQINNKIRDNVPFAVVGSNVWHDIQGKKILGRKTCCGLVEVENKNHSDFPLLRDLLIRTRMTDLIDTTCFHYYEKFRKDKLNSGEVKIFLEDFDDKTESPEHRESLNESDI